MGRDMWLKLKPVIRTKKESLYLTIPAFSAPCGPIRGCLEIKQPTTSVGPATSVGQVFTSFTISCWCFLYQQVYTGDYALFERNNGGAGGYLKAIIAFGTNTIKIEVAGNNGVTNSIDTGIVVPFYKWICISIMRGYNNTTGKTTIELYFDDILVFSDYANAATADTSGTINLYLGNNASGLVLGKFSHLRMWLNTLNLNPMTLFGRFSKIVGTGYLSLLYDLKFNEGSGVSVDVIGSQPQTLTINGVQQVLISTDEPPIGFGASFIAKRFLVASTGPSSLVFPVVQTEDVNHCLCVSYPDQNTLSTVRFKLYSANSDFGQEDIAPDPPVYNGEVLPANYYLEFWNVDGLSSVDLLSDFTLFTSHTRQPQHGIDHANAIDAIPVGSTLLAATLPANFPLLFNAQQTYL